MSDLYETDFAAWSAAQAEALRNAGRRRVNEPVDWENIAEEIEGLGRSERSELRNRIAMRTADVARNAPGFSNMG